MQAFCLFEEHSIVLLIFIISFHPIQDTIFCQTSMTITHPCPKEEKNYFQPSKLYLVVEIILVRCDYQTTLHNISEDQWSHLHCGRSLYLVISKPVIQIITHIPHPQKKNYAAFTQQSLKQ